MSMTFRVFVSSTFSDLKEERDALQTRVFKPLRKFCAQHGARFQAIDLRWGVSEEASRDQQTMNICLGEIRRCQQVTPRPNFVILLGERYGWCPPPPQIPGEEFDSIINNTSPKDQKIIKNWYRRDDNAVPAEYVLQPWDGYSYEEWGKIERKLHSALLSGAKAAELNKETMFKYWSSATHQEIAAGALSEYAEPEHVFAFIRKINDLPDDEAAREYLDFNLEGTRDFEANNHLVILKSELDHLLADNAHLYETDWVSNKPHIDYIDQLCKDMLNSLKGIIEDQLRDLEEVDPLELEISEHTKFRNERSRSFIGRKTILEKINLYISDQNINPLAIWGQSGSGKSALLGKAVANAEKEHQNAKIIYRFIGATPDSSNCRSLLESFCKQISRLYHTDESDIPIEYKDLVQEFPERMSLATQDKPLVIFIDALDQLGERDNPKALTWIPAELPENVRLIVSTLPGISLDALKTKLPNRYLVELEPLSFDQGSDLLDNWLDKADRNLQPEQRKEVIGKFNSNRLPLYLKLAFEEARLWKSYSDLCKLKPDIQGVLQDMFNRLSGETNHGKVLFSHALGYIAAAKNGLSEDEMLDLLSWDGEVMADFVRRSPKSPYVENLPVVIWSRLYTDLEPYLTQRSADGTNLMSFYHPTTFGNAVSEAFLGKDVKEERHRAIAHYFDEQPLIRGEENVQKGNLRKLSELPYQQSMGHMWDEIQSTLTDFDFIQTKISAVDLLSLINDFDEVEQAGYRKRDLSLVKSALQLSTNTVIRDNNQIGGQLIGRLMTQTEPAIQELVQRAKDWKGAPWLRPLSPSLIKPGGPLIRTLEGHRDSVTVMALTPDGRRAISGSGSKDKTLKVWDLESGEVLHTLEGHSKVISAVVVTHNGQRAISSSWDKTLKVWDLKSGAVLDTLAGHTNFINKVIVSPDETRAVSSSRDKTLRVWDLESGKALRTLVGHTDFTYAAGITSDGKRVVSVSLDETLKVWDLQTGQVLFTLAYGKEQGPPQGWIDWYKAVAVTPDGKRAICASSDKTLKVLSLKNRKMLYTLEGHSDHISTVAVTSDGHFAISTSKDNSLKLWDLDNGVLLNTFVGHGSNVNCVAIIPGEHRIISGSSDRKLKVWNLESGEELYTLEGHADPVIEVVTTPDGTRCISASADKTLKVWDLDRHGAQQALEYHKFGVSAVAVTPDGKRAITGSYDHNLKVWNLASGKSLYTLEGHTSVINKVEVTPDGLRAISGSNNGVIKVWDLEKGNENCTLKQIGAVISMTVTPDGTRVVSGGQAGTMMVWDLESGEVLHKLKGHKHRIPALAITPDGQHVITGSWDKKIIVWNLESGKMLHTFSGHNDKVTNVIVTTNGKFVISVSSWGKTLRVWDLDSGKELRTHTRIGTKVAITPDQRRVISGSKTLFKLWDLESGERIHTFNEKSNIKRVAVMPDGRYAIFISERSINVWDLKHGVQTAAFSTEGNVTSVDVGQLKHTIIAGDNNGRVHILRLENVNPA